LTLTGRKSKSNSKDDKYDSSGNWSIELSERYENLRNITLENMPKLWPGLEFALSVRAILNIKNCTLPFAGIILGPSSSLKTVIIELFRGYSNTFYTDNFSAKSLVSHNSSIKKEKLKEIDMLPKIKNKFFLTPELAPIFSAKDEDLLQVLGILTRVLDGHGYENDTGAQGHRGYNEDIMFTWLGAAVDIPFRVHKQLSVLGPKLYFFRLSKSEETEDTYYNQRDEIFQDKKQKIRAALLEYLTYFETNLNAEFEPDNPLPKIRLSPKEDEELPHRYIIRLAKLLARLRAIVPTWETRDTQGSGYAYTFANIEDPTRAIEVLRNLARGHALSQGRESITVDDIPVVINTVLSTASIERVRILDLLIANDGTLTTSQIEICLDISSPTARRTMTELKATGLVDMVSASAPEESKITLKREFSWFLTEEFDNLRSLKEKHPPRSIINNLFYDCIISKALIPRGTLSCYNMHMRQGGNSFNENRGESIKEPSSDYHPEEIITTDDKIVEDISLVDLLDKPPPRPAMTANDMDSASPPENYFTKDEKTLRAEKGAARSNIFYRQNIVHNVMPPACNNVETDLRRKVMDESADISFITRPELDHSGNSNPEYRSEISTANGIFPRNLIHDPKNVLNGILVLKCPFCTSYKTPIEFDMTIHLRKAHTSDLIETFPNGKGSNINYGIKCAIEKMKKGVPSEYYDSKVAKLGQKLPNIQKPKVEQMNKDELLNDWFSSGIDDLGLSRHCSPFVKWAGGKTQLLSELDIMIPSEFDRYFEPFLGGGAMFFHISSKNIQFISHLSDINEDLINAYKVVKDDVEVLIRLLKHHEKEYNNSCREYYYQLRAKIKPLTDVERAARFITLNKTCYNGLYRVNSKGIFNVPMGRYKNPLICDSENLRKVSIALRDSNAKIETIDYEDILRDKPREGDFIYLDRPYDPLSDTAYFTHYTHRGFTVQDQ